MNLTAHLLLILTVTFTSALHADSYRISFGSCYDQDNQNLPIWEAINNQQPDKFILVGDNVYIDSTDPAKFSQDYASLFANPGFSKLAKNADIMATWDDHDYGENDGGKEFSAKQIAKAAFVKAFDYPEIKDIPKDQGIFHSRTIEVEGKSIRFIILDTRWYRDPLIENRLSEQTRERFQLGPYRPHLDETKSLLGKAQWQWLETTIQEPADLNILVSSIQVLAENTAWETWMNFPHERKRLLTLLDQHAAGKVIILSGDVHRAEMSALPISDWELFELTSSGLSADMYPGKPNIHRLGPAYAEHNFGSLNIQIDGDSISVDAGIFDRDGDVLGQQIIEISN